MLDAIIGLFYKYQKIHLSCGESYIDFSARIKSKKVTINPRNNDALCFKYAATAALNHASAGEHPERIFSPN